MSNLLMLPMQMQTHITEPEKEPLSINLQVINSLLATQRLFILAQGMPHSRVGWFITPGD